MLQRLSTILLSALVLSPLPALAQSGAQDQPETSNDSKVSFFCGKTFDTASKSQVPTTLVWNPEKQGNVALIRWKSQYFDRSKYGNERRCQEVSKKFQKLWSAGSLNYIVTGTAANGLPIVCGVANEGDACDSNNQLFTLKKFTDKKVLLEQLSGIFEGKVSSPVYESGSGDGSYIDVRSLLRGKPVVSNQAPQRSKP
jgi:Circadian oscillating protein COP23